MLEILVEIFCNISCDLHITQRFFKRCSAGKVRATTIQCHSKDEKAHKTWAACTLSDIQSYRDLKAAKIHYPEQLRHPAHTVKYPCPEPCHYESKPTVSARTDYSGCGGSCFSNVLPFHNAALGLTWKFSSSPAGHTGNYYKTQIYQF